MCRDQLCLSTSNVSHCTLRVYLRDTTSHQALLNTLHNPGGALITPGVSHRPPQSSTGLAVSLSVSNSQSSTHPSLAHNLVVCAISPHVAGDAFPLPVGCPSSLASALSSFQRSFLFRSAAAAHGSSLVPSLVALSFPLDNGGAVELAGCARDSPISTELVSLPLSPTLLVLSTDSSLSIIYGQLLPFSGLIAQLAFRCP